MTIYHKIAAILEGGRSLVLVTVLQAGGSSPGKEGFKMLLAEDGELAGTVGGGALEARAVEEARELLRAGGTRLLELDLGELGMKCGGRVSLLLERLSGERPFVLFGGGHVNQALAPVLEMLGYRVTVFDPREEMRARLEGVPGREVLIGAYSDISAVAPRLLAGGACFIATHGHENDLAVLRQLLRLPADFRYIGLIGSRRKVQIALETLRAEGLAIPPVLYAPVGLDLGGGSPAEIAVAVAAELIALRHGRPVPHMRLAQAPREGASPPPG